MITHVAVFDAETGEIYKKLPPNRHHDVLHMMYDMGLRKLNSEKYIQGFLTVKEEFLDRKQAVDYALRQGQIAEDLYQLYSEDLW